MTPVEATTQIVVALISKGVTGANPGPDLDSTP